MTSGTSTGGSCCRSRSIPPTPAAAERPGCVRPPWLGCGLGMLAACHSRPHQDAVRVAPSWQDKASCMPAHALELQGGESIIDGFAGASRLRRHRSMLPWPVRTCAAGVLFALCGSAGQQDVARCSKSARPGQASDQPALARTLACVLKRAIGFDRLGPASFSRRAPTPRTAALMVRRWGRFAVRTATHTLLTATHTQRATEAEAPIGPNHRNRHAQRRTSILRAGPRGEAHVQNLRV